jgi:DNA-binding transcriptional MerR regulator
VREPAIVAASIDDRGDRSSSGGAREPELLKIGELAERAGVSPGTVRHYLREGLLPKPVKTSRNMAYYQPELADRIELIKRLQEERFMPLRVIREVLEDDSERIRALIELDERIHELLLAELAHRRGR